MHNNPYVDCPYNKAHQVPKLRLQHHLVKCRKQHPVSDMKTCPFNATHIMPEQELLYHFRFCEDKSLIEGQKYCSMNADHGDLGNPSFHHVLPTEDWDDKETSAGAIQETRQNTPLSINNVGTGFLGFGRGRASLVLSHMNSRNE